MASKDQSHTGGYECIFVEEPPDDLKCSICLCVARDPLQHGDGGCGKIFCRGCVKEHQEKSKECPNCRGELTTFKDNRSEKDILSLKVKCDNEGDGCQWMGELRSLDKHLQTCGYVKLPCPNMCHTITWSWRREYMYIFCKDLDNHLQEECPRRQYTCHHCEETGEYEHITGFLHRNTCPKMVISCPNEECRTIFLRKDKQAHLSVCPYQRVVCKYQEFGCQVEPLRKDLAAHEGDDKTHLRMTMDTLLVTREDLLATKKDFLIIKKDLLTARRELKERTGQLKLLTRNFSMLKTSCLTFKVDTFKNKKENNIEYYSTPFLTHPQGYKMTISVDANGYGDYVSVWVWLTRGEYDDQLKFPFKGTITFELLNQLEDTNHFMKQYTYDGKEEDSERVTGEERTRTAQGVRKFIRHSRLRHDATKNCQYLKDDCLVFRIYAEMPSYKPWLQCTATY